jgi:hypothetical protein
MKTSQRSCPTIQMVAHEFVERITLGLVEADRESAYDSAWGACYRVIRAGV